MKNIIRMEISVFFLTMLCQAAFLWAFLKKTDGIVQYADWSERDGILYYTTQGYTASKLLTAAFLLIVLIEASVTFYGIWKKSWLAVPAAATGMLLFIGMIVQSFYNAGARLERQIIFAALGFAAMCAYYFFVSVKLTDIQWAAVTAVLAGLILLNFFLAVYGLLTGNTVNGSSGWVRLGALSIQPGEFMKVLLILFSAFCYRARINKMLTIVYMGVSLGTVFVLVLSRDLGNAAILLLIWLISSWYLLGWKAALCIGVTAAGGTAAAVWKLAYVQERFRACFRALESGSGQQYNSLMAILKGGFRGIGPEGNTVAATSVTSSGTDLVFNVLFAVFGIAGVIFLIGLLLLQLTHLFMTPVISPFHYMLGVLGTVTFFFQYVLHIGGCLNVLPLTGICAPFLSYGGSNLICSFLIFGGILASFSPQFERRRFKVKAKEEKENGTENMEEEDSFFNDGPAAWDDAVMGIGLLANGGEKAVTALGYDRYIDWAEDSSVYVGKILDADGKELWTKEFPGYEDTSSIVGELKTNPLAENTVAVKYSDILLGTDTYNLIGGEESLSDAGQDISLTIRHELSESVYNYMKENGVSSGSALFTEADTGKILAAVSMPGASPYAALDELEDGALLNKNLCVTIPGSTMKIVTTALLAARCGEELREETAECTGTYPLLNGDVTCVTQRGIHDIESALGYSCNTFFAQKIIGILDADPKSTWENLERMGFSQEGQEVSLDRLHRTASSTGYDGDSSFSGTWSLIGQGTTQVSPIDMVRIVSALVNNGTAAEPYLVENVTNMYGLRTESHKIQKTELMAKETAQLVREMWKNAYDTYYPSELYNEQITMAKTGTAQYSDGSESSLLMGYIENSDVAFYIEIKNRDEAQISPAGVINHALNAGL